jgi:hypothetical protein
MKQVAATFYLVALTCGAQAQLIYRCGTEYSQTPCPGGKILESSDPRSAAERAEAVRVAAQDRRQAAAMERERRAQQAGIAPAQATGFNGRPPQAAASGAERGKVRKGDSKAKRDKNTDFVAVEPGTKKKRGTK